MQQLDTARAGVLTLLAPRYGMSVIGVPGRSSVIHPIYRVPFLLHVWCRYEVSRVQVDSTYKER